MTVTVTILLMVMSMMIYPPVLGLLASSLVHYQLHLMKYNNFCYGITLFVLCIFRNNLVVGSNSEQLIVSQADEVYVSM